MSDERVNVSKGLLDNVAKPLMQATETTDNLSLPEMATAAQMMLPAKWKLVVDTTLEEDVTGIEYNIPNAEEVHIQITNAETFSNGSFGVYVYLWGKTFYTGGTANEQTKVIMAHGKLMGNQAILEYGTVGSYSGNSLVYGTSSGRTGIQLAQQKVNDIFGLWIYQKAYSVLKGAKIKIWAKRRVSANE